MANGLHNPGQAVLCTLDGGRSWTAVTPPGLGRAGGSTTIESAAFMGTRRAWLIDGSPQGRHLSLLVTSDGGRVWSRIGPAPGGCSLEFASPADGWCVATNGAAGSEEVTIYRTRDGGRSWRQVSRTSPFGRRPGPHSLPFGCDKTVTLAGPELGFASSACNGGGGYVYRTTDGGTRWLRTLSETSPTGGSDGSEFTAVTAKGGLAAVGYTTQPYEATRAASVMLLSSDRGRTWVPHRLPDPSARYDIDLVTPRVWRLVNGRTVLATDDAGRTWTHVTGNVRFPAGAPIVFSTERVAWELGVGGGAGLLRTTDDGRIWRPVRLP